MKGFIVLISFILLISVTACVSQNQANDYLYESTISITDSRRMLDSGKYYCIYQDNANKTYYEIYDDKGKIAISDSTDRPLKICMINDNMVDISIGMGTGISMHTYYNTEENLSSKPFSYVIANLNELVAYIDVPHDHPFEGRKVVVQNVFNKDLFYKEYSIDFSRVDTPVTSASFSDDGSILKLTYLSGEDQEEVSKNIQLK